MRLAWRSFELQIHQRLRQLGTEIGAASEDSSGCNEDGLNCFFLHQVARCSRPHSQFSVETLVVEADDQNGGCRSGRLDIPDEVDPAAFLEGDIGNYQIGFQVKHRFESVARPFGFAANFQIGFLGNQLPQAVAHHRVIVHDQDSF